MWDILNEITARVFPKFLDDLARPSGTHASDVVGLIFFFSRSHLDAGAISGDDHGAAALPAS